MSKALQCYKCGGTFGTLVKVGDKYAHMREIDCARHRAMKIKREKVLEQVKPIEVTK
jgi:preprotein translocase subunit YajC